MVLRALKALRASSVSPVFMEKPASRESQAGLEKLEFRVSQELLEKPVSRVSQELLEKLEFRV